MKPEDIQCDSKLLSRFPHFLENGLTDGCEVVSLTHRLAALDPQEDSWLLISVRD
jgi:hypothetical protein